MPLCKKIINKTTKNQFLRYIFLYCSVGAIIITEWVSRAVLSQKATHGYQWFLPYPSQGGVEKEPEMFKIAYQIDTQHLFILNGEPIYMPLRFVPWGQLDGSVDWEPGPETGGPGFKSGIKTLPSCVTLGKSLNPHCLALTTLLSWNKYTVLVPKQKVRV